MNLAVLRLEPIELGGWIASQGVDCKVAIGEPQIGFIGVFICKPEL